MELVSRSQRPVLLVGSQALLPPTSPQELRSFVEVTNNFQKYIIKILIFKASRQATEVHPFSHWRIITFSRLKASKHNFQAFEIVQRATKPLLHHPPETVHANLLDQHGERSAGQEQPSSTQTLSQGRPQGGRPRYPCWWLEEVVVVAVAVVVVALVFVAVIVEVILL